MAFKFGNAQTQESGGKIEYQLRAGGELVPRSTYPLETGRKYVPALFPINDMEDLGMIVHYGTGEVIFADVNCSETLRESVR